MQIIDKTLSKNEIDFLKTLKGEKLMSFKGYELFEDIATWHETLVFQTSKIKFSIENQFQEVPFSDEDEAEDFGVITVSSKAEEIWIPSGMKPKLKRIDKRIKDVIVANCRVEYKNVTEDLNAFYFTQAVIFDFGHESLVINRDIWFNDFLIVKMTDDYKTEIRDVHEDWMCENNEYVEVEQIFLTLT